MATLELERAAQEHYADQRSLVQRIASLITQLGRMLSWDEVRAWFAGPSEVLYDAMVEAQAEAAAQGAAYVGTALAAAGVVSDPVAAVVPDSLAGIASDGRDLMSLLAWPIRRGERLVEQGARPEEVTPRVVAELVMIGRTQVADAGRIATGVAQVADRAVVGYVRMAELPACARCIILAGNLYSVAEPFLRHPNCDCIHVPVASLDEAGDLGREHHAAALFEQLSRTEQDRTFGRAGARAIRDGSDLHQVVNARRGLYTTADGHRATREGTTVRGFAGRRLGQMERQRGRRYRASRTVRLTPEQIYAEAGDDRDEALRLLHRFGYLTDLPSAPTRRERPAPTSTPRPEPAPVAPLAPRPEPEPVREPDPVPEPEPFVLPEEAEPYHLSLDGIEDLARKVEELDVVETRKLSGGASAQTDLITLADGTRLVRKRALASDPGGQDNDGEQVASILGRALGIPVPRVYRRDKDLFMEYVPDSRVAAEADSSEVEQAVASDDGKRIGLLDVLLMNADRNSGNWLLADGRPVPIDHGLAYAFLDFPGTVDLANGPFADHYRVRPDAEAPELIDNPLTRADIETARRAIEPLREDFAHLSRLEWYDHAMGMLDRLAEHATGTTNLF